MNRHNRPRKRGHDQAVVLIELVLVLPVLAIIAFISLEVARSMQLDQMAATLSREAASMAYRDCSGDPALKLRHCLTLVQEVVAGYANNLIPGSEIIISLYSFDANTSTFDRFEQADPPGGEVSVFSPAGNRISGLTPAFPSRQGVVAIGEAFVPYNPLFPGFARMFSFTPRMRHDAAIL